MPNPTFLDAMFTPPRRSAALRRGGDHRQGGNDFIKLRLIVWVPSRVT